LTCLLLLVMLISLSQVFSFVIEEREKNQVSFYSYWREKDTPPPLYGQLD